jgi:hypothetical protein
MVLLTLLIFKVTFFTLIYENNRVVGIPYGLVYIDSFDIVI